MTAVAATWQARFPRPMPSTTTPTPAEQAIAMGRALQNLRKRARPGGPEVTQEEAAGQINITRQAWQNYEAGKRDKILNQALQEQLVRALDTTRETLLLEYQKVIGHAPRRSEAAIDRAGPPAFELIVPSRVKAGKRAPLAYDLGEPDSTVDMAWMFGPNGSGLRVAGDSMTGYVESGQLVIFDRTRWPSRGEGCVIETSDGELYVKEYVAQEGAILRVRQRFPEELLEFPMNDIKGVYAIRLRGA